MIPDNIVFLSTAFIGDVALSLYAAGALREAFPKARLCFVTTATSAPLLRVCSDIDVVVGIDKRGDLATQRQAVEALRAEGTAALIAHRSVRSALLLRSLRAEYSVTWHDAAARWMASRSVRRRADVHEVRRILALVEALTGTNIAVPPMPNLSLPPCDIEASAVPTVALFPGSVWATKRWPAEYFQSLATHLCAQGHRVLVMGSPAEADLCAMVASKSSAVSLAGTLSLPETLAALAACDVAVTNDSAPLHLSELVGTPAVAIFGPTHPVLGFGPIGERSEVVQQSLDCRPCRVHGSHRCPLGHHACMHSITPQRVFNTVEQLLHGRVS